MQVHEGAAASRWTHRHPRVELAVSTVVIGQGDDNGIGGRSCTYQQAHVIEKSVSLTSCLWIPVHQKAYIGV
jgi:hypothetical protein